MCVRRSVYHSPQRDEGKLSLWPAARVYRALCPLLAIITLGVLHMIEVRQHRLFAPLGSSISAEGMAWNSIFPPTMSENQSVKHKPWSELVRR